MAVLVYLAVLPCIIKSQVFFLSNSLKKSQVTLKKWSMCTKYQHFLEKKIFSYCYYLFLIQGDFALRCDCLPNNGGRAAWADLFQYFDWSWFWGGPYCSASCKLGISKIMYLLKQITKKYSLSCTVCFNLEVSS